MVTPTRKRLIPLWAGVAFALLVGGLVAPEKARAGCSHYVLAKSDGLSFATPSSLELLVPTAMPAAPVDAPLPCAGLSCSRDPLAPTVPPTIPVRVGEWGCLVVSAQLERTEPFVKRPESGSVRPIHQGLSIDRPPRTFPSYLSSRV